MSESTANKANRAAVIGKTLAHPLRVEIIEACAGQGTARSPSELAKRLAEPIANVSYHVRSLVDTGALTMSRTEPRRGAIEHYYRLTPLGEALLLLLDSL